jgi:branched-chain amino acid transport system ATP-binding protein
MSTGEPLLLAEDVTAGYGPVTVLRGVTLVARKGELVTVLGANGAGKSTLLSAVVGLLTPRTGRVMFAGRDITGRTPEVIARQRLVMVPEGRQLFGPMSILDNLLLGAHGQRGRRALSDRLDRVFELFPVLGERPRLPAASLSGGQQQMLAIGRALMADPKMLLLDEPSLGLAPLITRQLFDILRILHDAGVSILLVEQNVAVSLKIAGHAYVLENGRIVLGGRGQDLLRDERVRVAYLGQ